MLTKRSIRIESERRSEIDLHYLGQALLRLAQEQYDLERGPNRPAAPGPAGAPVRALEAHRGPNWPGSGIGRRIGVPAPPGRHEGARG